MKSVLRSSVLEPHLLWLTALSARSLCPIFVFHLFDVTCKGHIPIKLHSQEFWCVIPLDLLTIQYQVYWMAR